MKKKFIYIKPINLADQIEDKINKSIPIKTEESFNYFKPKTNFDMNDDYFKIIMNPNISNKENSNRASVNFRKIYFNNNSDIRSQNQNKKVANLKDSKSINSYKKDRINEKNIVLLRKRENKKEEEEPSLTLRNYTLNNTINNKNKPFYENTIKEILRPRKCLHEIYAQNKRINNNSYRKISSSLTIVTNNKKWKKKEINKDNHNIKRYKLNNNPRKQKQKPEDKNQKTNNQIKYGLYDPISKTLRYKHFTELKKYNQTKNKTLPLNNPKLFKGVDVNTNKNILDKYQNINNSNEINYLNQSLLKYKKENEQNLARLKKMMLNKKIEHINKNIFNEESKTNFNQDEKKILKRTINEKIKNIIINERKKLEESIDDYKKKLDINFNKRKLLLKNYKENKFLINLTEINNEKNDNEENLDNMDILSDFHFNRNNKF